MTSRIEQDLCSRLRSILSETPIGESIWDHPQIGDVTWRLERFIPAVLGEIHCEWQHEGLDGIFPLVFRKTEGGEAELFGLCLLISDQTLTPIHVRLQVAVSSDEVSWLECRLGEMGDQGMMRIPYEFEGPRQKRIHALEGRKDLIDWVYKVTFGERRK
jgi:hypothetical protein